jgi:nickel transport protein
MRWGNLARRVESQIIKTSRLWRSHMKRSVNYGSLGAAVLCALTAMDSDAHGIWFAQRAEQIAVIYGVGGDDLDAAGKKSSYSGTAAYDADYQPIDASLRVAGPLLLVDVDAKPTVLSVVMDNGTWSQDAAGKWQKGGRDVNPSTKLAETAMKYAVSVQGPLTRPIPALKGQTLQIVPMTPIPEKLGTSMTYRVLFNGKPVEGATVIPDFVNDPDAARVKTKADGTVSLPVRNQGLNVVWAEYFGPAVDPKKAHRIDHVATLSFTLKNSES